MEPTRRIVKRGTWLYDDAVRKAVVIIEQNWDLYHEEWYDDPPDLDENGLAYYVGYPEPNSRTCLSIEEAVNLATTTITGPIVWQE